MAKDEVTERLTAEEREPDRAEETEMRMGRVLTRNHELATRIAELEGLLLGTGLEARCAEPTRETQAVKDEWTAECGCRCVSSGPGKCPGCHLCSFLIKSPHV